SVPQWKRDQWVRRIAAAGRSSCPGRTDGFIAFELCSGTQESLEGNMIYKTARNMLNRIFLGALILASVASILLFPVSAQQSKDTRLIWRAESPCSGSDCLQELFYNWPDELKNGDGAVFIRVCSQQTLLHAFANAAVNPIEAASWIQHFYHFKMEQIS